MTEPDQTSKAGLTEAGIGAGKGSDGSQATVARDTSPEKMSSPGVDRPGVDRDEPYHHQGENQPTHSHHDEEVKSEGVIHRYWSANIRLVFSLLAIWFAVSFGAGILFVDGLNNVKLGGYPLGFWFAQQGSIFVFVGLIFYYAYRMKAIERRFGVDDDD